MYQLTETFTDGFSPTRTLAAPRTTDRDALNWASHLVASMWVYRKDPTWEGATLTDAGGYTVATWTPSTLTAHPRPITP